MLETSQVINRGFSGISNSILFRTSGVSLINEGWRLDFSRRNLSINSAFFFPIHCYSLTQ